MRGLERRAGFAPHDDRDDAYDDDIAGPNNDDIIGISKLGKSGGRISEEIAAVGGERL